ncbi:acetyltransferase [Lachnospiraceae bacterium KM106-2]|nr:acetyltransferase [Lachnospiraceae bacterium KM106-2]
MKITKLLGNEIKEHESKLRKLWKDCFGDTENYMDFYFDEKPKDSVVFAIFDEEMLCSMLWLNPYEMYVNGQRKDAYYIVGVATDQNYRSRGFMRSLLLESFAFLYNKGDAFTYLMPAAEAIYAPYDFRFIYDKERLQVKEDLRIEEISPYEVLSWKMLSASEKENAVIFVNEILVQNFSLATARSVAYYDRLDHEMHACNGEVIVFYENGQMAGIVPFMQEEGQVEVAEAVFQHKVSISVISAAIAKWYPEAKIGFLESYSLDKQLSGEKKPMIMARIINMEQFLKVLTIDEDCSIIIGVKDSFIKENEGNYQITFESGMTHVMKTNDPAEIIMDIAEWTSYFFGYYESKREDLHLTDLKKIHKIKSKYINEIV